MKIFKFLVYFIFLLQFSYCSKKETSESIGQEIIHQNLPIILDSIDRYYALTDNILSNNERRNNTVEVEDSVSYDDFTLNECVPCLVEIKNDRLNINQNRFTEFKIDVLPINQINGYDIVLTKPKKGLYNRKVIEVSFSNLYIDKNKQKAFIIIEKRAANSKGTTVDVYFFENREKKWKYLKKQRIMIG
ncbi:hypothetical protein [Chryseobacterium paridis]|uniref:Lipoprotein n=1 Tax=Chryseobacterium paridis TaxID=2800328 RepID=A0ABS1FUN6_9FLAO|nr:hypothetical protein [Chryseobacterium paridis]MBK1896130.1 hypothetical protein [Chryseobacterium paridis]